MKAVPKVDINGFFIEDVLVDDSFEGLGPEYGEGSVIIAYTVGFPVTPGLYKPRFDFDAWEFYKDALENAEQAYLIAHAEWSAEPEDTRGEEPNYLDFLPQQPELWEEGLTPEEIAELHKPPEKTPDQQKIEDLEQRLQVAQQAIDFLLFSQGT